MPSPLYTGPILSPEHTLLLFALSGVCTLLGMLLVEGSVLRFLRLYTQKQEPQGIPQEGTVLP